MFYRVAVVIYCSYYAALSGWCVSSLSDQNTSKRRLRSISRNLSTVRLLNISYWRFFTFSPWIPSKEYILDRDIKSSTGDLVEHMIKSRVDHWISRSNIYRICRNKRPGRLIFRSNKTNSKSHRFCVLPPLKNHPSTPIGFVYSPLWKITVFGGRLVRVGAYFGKYGLPYLV